MRRILLVILAAAVASCSDRPENLTAPDPAAGPVASASAGSPPDFMPGRLLVRFQPGAPAAQIARAQGAELEGPLALGIDILSVPVGNEVAIAAALSRNPDVVWAEPDLFYPLEIECKVEGGTCTGPTDQYFGYKWDLHNDGTITNSLGEDLANTGTVDADMDWLEAFHHLGGSYTGTAVIGVIDSGIRATHEELAGRVAGMVDFFGSTSGADDNGHGTHVSTTAMAGGDNFGVPGVAWGANVKVLSAKVCGVTFGIFYGCNSTAIVNGIRWAADNGAHAINLSLGGASGSSAQRDALIYARGKNVLAFCAAGNDNGSVSYPAAFPECVAVSATNWSDGKASYSNFGPEIELAAPGGDTEHPDGYSYILAGYYSSNTSYAFMAGTSMASPQAAGLAGLLHALGVESWQDKLAIMKNTADDIGSATFFGAGRINAWQAVLAAVGGEPPPPPPTGPTADFTFDCPNLTCDFTDQSTAGDAAITGWAWDFGDGNGSTDQSPSHSYGDGGTYSVKLTVTDGNDLTSEVTKSVEVTDPAAPPTGPTADFSFSCTDLDCDFTDTSTAGDAEITGWSWDFGDGNGSTAQNPSHSYGEGGTYSVKLTVTDGSDLTSEATKQVSVSATSSEGIDLHTVDAYKVRGRKHADLGWSGTDASQMDIRRDGAVVATVANTGEYTHATNEVGGGSHTYEVCEAGTQTCSNMVTVNY